MSGEQLDARVTTVTPTAFRPSAFDTDPPAAPGEMTEVLRPAKQPTTPARRVAGSGETVRRGWRAAGSPAPVLAAEVGSRFLYVAEQGAYLRREGSRVKVTKKDAVLLEVPAMKLQAIALYGNVQVSAQCLRKLLDEGVSLSLFSRNGTYRGRLQPPIERGGALRRRQWECAGDAAFCLELGRAVVRGKLLGARQVAAAYAKNYPAATLGSAHQALAGALDRVECVATLDELRGVEGTASRAWFDLFRRCNRSEMSFEGRAKRPPADPLNALLSFGYTLVLGELEGLIEGAGLDPAVGFYHTAHANRPALACDWIEEYRHALVDRLVLTLVNRGEIRAEHFQDLEERGLRLTPDGLRTFLRAYEQAMLAGGAATSAEGDGPEENRSSGNGWAGGYRAVFLRQLGQLLDAIAGRGSYRSHLETAGGAGEVAVSAAASGATPSPLTAASAG